ncbi:MAG: S8 family serine peptidase [Micromonosporaceae bacterium]
MRIRISGVAAFGALLALGVTAALTPASAQTSAASGRARAAHSAARIVPIAVRLGNKHWQTPPTTADCIASAGIPCYAPFQLQQAYDLKPLYAHGLTGRGRTIVIVDAFGSPTVQADLQKFDTDFGLPAPPHFTIIQPAGPVPPFDPTDPDMAGWGEETSLDVQWAHSIAPGANILLVETPVSETEGVQGFPEIVMAENYVINHHLGDVISQSFGATENTFPSVKSLLQLRSAYKNAFAHHVTVLGSSGDTGPTDYTVNGDLYTHRVNSWPSSDPLVTSLGGTQLHLDANGNRTAPDNVWNDQALFGTAAASGGGKSHVFGRPAYQNSVKKVVGGARGTPDISMSAAVDGGVLVYIGFTGGDGITPGYYIFGGTSEASPEFAGVVAIADQNAHRRLGLLNPALYDLAKHHAPGIVDVTIGDNTVTFSQGGQTYTVPGFPAVRGYDMSTGLGTVDAAKLVGELRR